MFSFLLGLFRFLLFVLYVSFFLVIYYFLSFFWRKEANFEKGVFLRDFLIRITLFVLGIRITVYGKKPSTQGLIVANHRSYLDPIVMVSQVHAFTVGKKEVESWPLIGYICKVSGVLFVNRKCEKSRQDTIEKIRNVLNKGFSIINFPEGTTDVLPTTLPFKKGSFAMATKVKSALIPVAIDYKEKSDAFVGNDTFVPHFIKCFGKPITEIKMTFFEPIYSEDTQFLLNTSKDLIDKELIRYRKDWDNEK
jgi:1-acyl-sn-glycerol-3-phosphate acyltransferase